MATTAPTTLMRRWAAKITIFVAALGVISTLGLGVEGVASASAHSGDDCCCDKADQPQEATADGHDCCTAQQVSDCSCHFESHHGQPPGQSLALTGSTITYAPHAAAKVDVHVALPQPRAPSKTRPADSLPPSASGPPAYLRHQVLRL